MALKHKATGSVAEMDEETHEHTHEPAPPTPPKDSLAGAMAEHAEGAKEATPAGGPPTVSPAAVNPQTQETTGATRFKNGVIITMRGAGSKGNDPYTIGSGGDVALRLQVPVTQQANVLQVEQPDGTVIWSISGSGVPGAATVTLTPAQVLTLNTAPTNLIPAPAANQAIYVQGMTVQLKWTAGNVQYTGGGPVQPVYHGATVDLLTGNVAAATINGNVTAVVSAGGPAGITLTPGVGVDLYAGTANFAAGNSPVIVTIVYSIVTLG